MQQKGALDGVVGTIVSVLGGLAGGVFVSKVGLKRSLVFLAICLNVPHLCYVILSQTVTPTAPLPLPIIYLLVCIEKFGYNFGFVGNMLYMMQQIAPGKYKMTHYAFATSLMNLVLVPTQSVSGRLADWMGYATSSSSCWSLPSPASSPHGERPSPIRPMSSRRGRGQPSARFRSRRPDPALSPARRVAAARPYWTCAEIILAMSNMLTWRRPPKIGRSLSSALIMRRFFRSCSPSAFT